MARIALEHIDKVYPNGYVAAGDLSLEVADGELLVLVGPSGRGKSTVRRLMAGLERVTDGVIRIGERDVTDLPPQQRDIAMVFQNYALYPHMTVRDNLAFGLAIRKQPRDIIDQRVNTVASSLGLDALLDGQPREVPVQCLVAVLELLCFGLCVQLTRVRTNAVLANEILPPFEEPPGRAAAMPAEIAGLRTLRQLLARDLQRMTGSSRRAARCV